LSLEKKDATATNDLPSAKIKKHPRSCLIWIVPLIAAVAAGWLIFKYVSDIGPLITIQFNDGNGLQANQTVIKYHGVRIGEVRSVRLAADTVHVEVQARLAASAKYLAREGSQFWIVRPEVGAGGLHGLETIVSGPYIQVQPGGGQPQIKTLSIGSPVYYRGIEVGAVEYFVLDPNATQVQIHLLIKPAFAPLVRADTKFWNAGGISVRLKLLGISISAETFKSLIIGGIAFATPSIPGDVVSNGCMFQLKKKVDEKWLEWSPVIAVTNASATVSQNPPASLLLDSMDTDSK
jgi:paraquat-inducible protein B